MLQNRQGRTDFDEKRGTEEEEEEEGKRDRIPSFQFLTGGILKNARDVEREKKRKEESTRREGRSSNTCV